MGRNLPFQRSGTFATTVSVGAGWSGSTSTPSPIGSVSDAGYEGVCVARWTDIPYRTITEVEWFGVAAFHRNGIDRVEFSANNGAWVSVVAMTAHPDTGVWAYHCKIDPAATSDQLVEIRARIYPSTAGTCRVLGGDYASSLTTGPNVNGVYSQYVWTNDGGTYDGTYKYVGAAGNDTTGDGSLGNPYLTIRRAVAAIGATLDNCEVRCLAGSYDMSTYTSGDIPTADSRWFTICAAPGLTNADVSITQAVLSHNRQHLMLFRDVSAVTSDNSDWYDGINLGRNVCAERCAFTCPAGRYGTGGTGTNSSPFTNCTAYVIESEWTDLTNGPWYCQMARNVEMSTICADAYSGIPCVLNCTIDGVDPGSTGAHSDIHQLYSPGFAFDNILVYGVKATNSLAQGIFWPAGAAFASVSNSAVVNFSMDMDLSIDNYTQLSNGMQHCLFLHCSFHQHALFVGATDGGMANCAFIGNLFISMKADYGATAAGNDNLWHANHFGFDTGYLIIAPGTDVTAGLPPEVVSWETSDLGSDMTPSSGSELLSRVTRIVRRDVDGVARPVLSAVGAYERP